MAISLLSREDFLDWSLLDMYNFIRALTNPYPNAFLIDEKGNKLVFKEVQYILNTDIYNKTDGGK